MTSASAEPGRWRASRWGSIVVLVLVLQVFLVFWLGERGSVRPRRIAATPTYRLLSDSSNLWLTLQDPTLFALPHREGFSGMAWLEDPKFEFEAKDFTEPPLLFNLPVAELGSEFKRFVAHHEEPHFPAPRLPPPEWTAPDVIPALPIAQPSSLRVEGPLASRSLLSNFELPSQPGTDLLTNTVVQLLVDARGNTFSAVLLPNPNSRDPDQSRADQYALNLAQHARFGATPTKDDAVGGVTFGTMVFQWQTVPQPATNSPSATP